LQAEAKQKLLVEFIPRDWRCEHDNQYTDDN